MTKKAGRPAQDRQSMVQMLVEAVLLGDSKAAKKYGVTRQTLLNYRKLLKDDPSFFTLFEQTSNALLTRPWADDLDSALGKTVNKMVQMVEAQVNGEPEALEAVTKAFTALSEIQLAREVLGAANSNQDAAPATAGRPASPSYRSSFN
jgi:hypothetical protein